jgi:PTS system nitrogen regulatory IIA component
VGRLRAFAGEHKEQLVMDLGDLIKQDLATRAAELTGLESRFVFETLLQRERLGSTGLGRGIAIPHGRMPGLRSMFCLFAKLDEAIDFEAPDGEPVDLIFLLLAPETAGADHLKALSRVSRLLREPHVIERLRGARNRPALYAILTEPLASSAA